jgi:hypothetical protein
MIMNIRRLASPVITTSLGYPQDYRHDESETHQAHHRHDDPLVPEHHSPPNCLKIISAI